jgi:hypothetical protein
MLGRLRVLGVDFHRGLGQRLVGIAARLGRRLEAALFLAGRKIIVAVSVQVGLVRLGLVFDLHQPRAVARQFECFGDHQRNRLHGVHNGRVV